MNPQQYKSVLGASYAWSVIRLFRVINFYQVLLNGRSLVQRYSDRTQSIYGQEKDDSLLFDHEPLEKKVDRGLLIQGSEALFRLEVSLVYDQACSQEIYDLLACDRIAEADLSSQIFYKSYYDASKSHGQLQLDRMQHNLCLIHQTHKALRTLLSRCKEKVTWDVHLHSFGRLEANLRLDNTEIKPSKGKHWERLGFQGDDPSTDFRGVGELGLHHLEHFTSRHPLYATQMIKESGSAVLESSDQPWYPFALCSIHTTKLTCDLLQTGYLERQLLQAQVNGVEGVQQFVDALFCFLFVRCHLDWAEGVDKAEITSVLQFEAFFKEFGDYIRFEIWTKRWTNDDFHPRGKWW